MKWNLSSRAAEELLDTTLILVQLLECTVWLTSQVAVQRGPALGGIYYVISASSLCVQSHSKVHDNQIVLISHDL